MSICQPEQRGGSSSSTSHRIAQRSAAPLATVAGRAEPRVEPKPHAAARKATSTLRQYGLQLAQNMQREGAIRGSPTFRRCIPLPGDVRIPTPRDCVRATTVAPRTPKSRRRARTTSGVSSLQNEVREDTEKKINSSMAALSVRRENLHEQACRPSMSQESPEHFDLQYDENHQLSNGQALLSQEGRSETVCKDPECRPLRSQPCLFCASSFATGGAAATPMATSPPDRAPDSPRHKAQPASYFISATEQQAPCKAARNLPVQAAMRDRELALR